MTLNLPREEEVVLLECIIRLLGLKDSPRNDCKTQNWKGDKTKSVLEYLVSSSDSMLIYENICPISLVVSFPYFRFHS